MSRVGRLPTYIRRCWFEVRVRGQLLFFSLCFGGGLLCTLQAISWTPPTVVDFVWLLSPCSLLEVVRTCVCLSNPVCRGVAFVSMLEVILGCPLSVAVGLLGGQLN